MVEVLFYFGLFLEIYVGQHTEALKQFLQLNIPLNISQEDHGGQLGKNLSVIP